MKPEQWLQLGDELGVELAKVLTPGPWRHRDRATMDPHFVCECCKCGRKGKTSGQLLFKADCPVPDPIKLDWNTAMEWRMT